MTAMNHKPLPVLYSFRRCPYAIRARMAVFNAGINVELHEVSLKHKPQAMLTASPKGTVPVLCVAGKVIDESLDIMRWALSIHDPDHWYCAYSETDKLIAQRLIHENDTDFKSWLDKFKYAERFPDHSADFYRQQCEAFLQTLDQRLQQQAYLLTTTLSFADVAIFPFVRQFSMVEKTWFDQCGYMHLRRWLNSLLDLALFKRVMAK
jgi:glutathione S-transferase